MKTTRLSLLLILVAFSFVITHNAAAQRVRPGGSSPVVTPPAPVVINPVSKG